jgi:8-oxo-dGTP diphosphatase
MCRVDPFPAYPHEVLAVVLSVRADALNVLLWRRAQAPHARRWALPGGGVRPDQRLREALSAHLAAKVDVRDISWLEQIATHSKVDRDPRARVLATGYLALVPTAVEPELPADTAWHPVADLPRLAFDHPDFIHSAVDRLRAKLSYTNIGFALAPPEFTINQLREIVSAALGYDVGATNLQRVMTRRQMIEPTGNQSTPGPGGGRPAALYRFRQRTLNITDPFAVFRPPTP